tara:strand:- start:163 stop:615 length:453 start_codon:yes stop_codon:yes gene_type:complete
MTIEPNHPTDYRMVKLIDGTLLVGTISVDEQFLRIENPLMLTTVQRMTEFGLKDDSSLSPWIPFTSDEKFNISKDKIMVISMAAQELASYYEVVLNKYKSQRKRAPLTPEEMKHILDVAEEMDNRQKELQQDEILDDEFSGYKFTSKKLN